MPAQSPEQLGHLIRDAINAGDVDAALTLYEPDAIIAHEPGKYITGLDAIREVMTNFTDLNPKETVQETVDVLLILQAGDVALSLTKWTVTGTGLDGSVVNQEGKGIQIVRRQADGTWKYVVDNPHGSP
jgi:uncharacterized protein (TIGR02246 family)